MSSYFTWFEAHEKLILSIVFCVALWFAIGKVDGIIAAHDHANLISQQQVLASQVEKNTELAAQVAEQAAQYQAMAEKVAQQNAALEQANVALAAALTRQQKVDSVMTTPEIVQRWEELVPASGLSIVNGNVSVTDAGAHATVNELEKVPVLTQELAGVKTEAQNVDTLLAASTAQVGTLNSRVDGLNAQIIDSEKVCDARVAVVTADARKSKRKWFVAGFVAGIATRIFAKF